MIFKIHDEINFNSVLNYLWLHNHKEDAGEDLSNDDGDKYDQDNCDDGGSSKISHNVSMIDL